MTGDFTGDAGDSDGDADPLPSLTKRKIPGNTWPYSSVCEANKLLKSLVGTQLCLVVKCLVATQFCFSVASARGAFFWLKFLHNAVHLTNFTLLKQYI